jgi:hypothetical protein
MSKNTLSLKDDKIFENIDCVRGDLELIFAGLTGDFTSIDNGSVQALINDAQGKLDEVREALLQGV